MEGMIRVKEQGMGWEWLERVGVEEFSWVMEILCRISDKIDSYEFGRLDKEGRNGEGGYGVMEMNRKGLGQLMKDDEGYEGGI